jgi:hypothetical protein
MEATGPSREFLIAYFVELTDDYLLEVYNSRTLIDLAVEVADEELTRRTIPHAPPIFMREENNEPQKPSNGESIIFETVARSWSTSQIEILRARLEAEGIPAFVIDGGMSQLYSFIAQPIGGARLQVLRERAREAREIIAAVNSGALAATNQDVEI